MKRNGKQDDLFGGAFQPRKHPYDGREDRRAYRAILVLRFVGMRVYRNGNHHMVDGRVLTTPHMVLLAKALQGTIVAGKGLGQEPWRSHYATIKSI